MLSRVHCQLSTVNCQLSRASVSKESFSETEDGSALYCCAVVHGGASHLPDFLDYLGDVHGNVAVKHGILGRPRDLETCRLRDYRDKVRDTYKGGTYRVGHLDNISLVGTVAEEAGGYVPDVLDLLEESPFLKLVLWHALKDQKAAGASIFSLSRPCPGENCRC